MKRFTLFKSLLLAAGLLAGSSAWAQTDGMKWSAIYTSDFSDAADATLWETGNGDRYNSAQITRSGDDKAVEMQPSGNGNNGTTNNFKKIKNLGTDYTSAAEYKVEFEFNISANYGNKTNSNVTNMQICDTSGALLVGFYQTAAGNDGSQAGKIIYKKGVADEEKELGDITFFKYASTPTEYHKVEITGDATNGTVMKFTPAGGTAVSYKLSESVIYLGNITHLTGRYYNHLVFDNFGVYKAVPADEVQKPTISITGVNGNSRTVSITHEEDDAIIYYTDDDGTTWKKYTSPFAVSTAKTFKAKATMKTGDYATLSSSDFSDETDAFDVAAGEGVLLAGVSITRTGENTYYLSTDQMGVLCTPTPTIHYALDGVEKGTFPGSTPSASTSVTIEGYGEVSAWATAEGYTQSTAATQTVIASPVTKAVWEVDLDAYGINTQTGSGNGAVLKYTTDDSAIDGTYKALLFVDESAVNNDFRIVESSAWLLRNGNLGLKAQSGASNIGFYGAKAGQYIIINYAKEGSKGGFDVASGDAAAYLDFGGNKVFKVSGDGDIKLNVAVGTTIHKVGLYDEISSVPATITSAGWATLYTAYALDFSAATPTALEAYTATVSGTTVTLTKVDNVPAGTGVVLKGSGDYTIPTLLASSTAKGDLKGSTTAATAFNAETGKTLYVLTKAGEKAQFNPVTSGAIPAGKAYLSVTSGGSANLRVVIDGEEATGIHAVEAATAEDGVTYNVAGQRVSEGYKGIVIKNGKKYLRK